MIRIVKELDVDVTKPNIFQAIVAKQYDMNSRFLKVTFMDCGSRIDIPSTSTTKVIINAERKDGQSKGFDGVINDDGTVTVPLHSWMLELDGTVICDISVVDTANDKEKKLTTTSFTLLVEKAAYGGDDITSDPQYDVLLELIENVESLSSSSLFANAIKNTVKGNSVVLTDQSSVNHELNINVISKNLLNPECLTNIEVPEGVNWTVNDDGTVTFERTQGGNTFYTKSMTLGAGTYYWAHNRTGAENGSIYPFVNGNPIVENSFIITSPAEVKFCISGGPAGTCNLGLIITTSSDTSYVPYKVEGVEVTRQGRNLIDPDEIKPDAKALNIYIHKEKPLLLQAGTYTFSFFGGGKYALQQTSIANYDTGENIYFSYANKEKVTFTINNATHVGISVYNGNGFTDYAEPHFKTYFQLESGATANDYESYVKPQTFIANEEGKVNGVTLIYPTIVLTNDADLPMEVTYSVDTKKYIDNKFAELSAALLNS